MWYLALRKIDDFWVYALMFNHLPFSDHANRSKAKLLSLNELLAHSRLAKSWGKEGGAWLRKRPCRPSSKPLRCIVIAELLGMLRNDVPSRRKVVVLCHLSLPVHTPTSPDPQSASCSWSSKCDIVVPHLARKQSFVSLCSTYSRGR